MKLRDLMLAAPLLLGAAPALADTTTPLVNIRVDHGSVWRAVGKQNSTEGFIQIHNDGSTPDVLNAWSCPDADNTVLMGKNGKPLTQLMIPPKQTVTLAPGGIYLALSSLHYDVERGTVVPCAFTFAVAGQVGGFLNEIKRP
ncbi:MAG: copper chaperone PCu(A)C [Rhodospirillales bacterium]|nr:copper chaperone PCu(A)C [Rhodospirillales bacterium]MDE2318870.1 copper chaperone PCu(A)C [Rhodospirillales bacterium]